MRGLAVMCALGSVLVAAAVPAGAAGPKGSKANPYPLRSLVGLPGSGWKLRVNKTVPDASLALLGNGTYAVRPDKQFFLINLTVRYTGTSPHAVFSAYTLYAIGRSGLVFTQLNDSCGTVRHALKDFLRVRPGSQTTGNVCFWVPHEDARLLVLEYHSKHVKVFFRLR